MADKEQFPTTDIYNLETHIQLNTPLLGQHFKNAINGRANVLPDLDLVKALTGKNTIKVEQSDTATGLYTGHDETIHLRSNNALDDKVLDIPRHAIPARVPEELTPELARLLTTLHEAEHATQLIFKEGPDRVLSGTNILNDPQNMAQAYNLKLIAEMDGDIARDQYLEDKDMGHIATFYSDLRMMRSFVFSYPVRDHNDEDHDTSTLTDHYKETGDLIDPAAFLDAKNSLFAKIDKQVNFSVNSFVGVMNENPEFKARLQEVVHDEEANLRLDEKLTMPAPVILHALQTLIDEGQLEGLEKYEAERGVAALTRLGYEPQAGFDYTANLVEMIQNDPDFQSNPEPVVVPEEQAQSLQIPIIKP